MAIDDASDLIGNISGSNPDEGAANQGVSSGALGAVDQGIRAASNKDDAADREKEEALVKRFMAEYTTARSFDKNQLAGMAKDRQYAAGISDPRWASDANLIGSFIDILTSFLYAQNPDVGARPARKVETTPDQNSTDLAETLEIVISKLWQMSTNDGGLKKSVRAQVRSTLTVGSGWIKGMMWSKTRPQPQVEKKIQTLEQQLSYIRALRDSAEDQGNDTQVTQGMIEIALKGLRAKKMLLTEFGLKIGRAHV